MQFPEEFPYAYNSHTQKVLENLQATASDKRAQQAEFTQMNQHFNMALNNHTP
jgi:hypothetical protein